MANSQQQGSWKKVNGRYTIRWRLRDAASKTGWASRMRTLPVGTSKKQMLAERDKEVKLANENNNREPIKPEPKALQTEAGLTFREFTNGQWTRWLDSEGKKPATRATYDSLLDNWILPKLGNVPLRGITVAMITDLFTELKEKRAPATGVLVYAPLSNMFKVAEDHELITTIPLRLKRHRPKLKKSTKPAHAPDVVRQVVMAADPDYRAILWTFALTGLRAGEVTGLRWADIDFQQRLIHVRNNLWRGRLLTPKTEGSQASIGLPSLLANVLTAHKAGSRWTGPDDFVFVAVDGSTYSQEHLRRKALRPAMKRVGIEYQPGKTSFHWFRRSLATYIMKHTGNLMRAQVQLRHESATTTAEAYLCPDESVIRDNVAVIESAFMVEPETTAVQ